MRKEEKLERRFEKLLYETENKVLINAYNKFKVEHMKTLNIVMNQFDTIGAKNKRLEKEKAELKDLAEISIENMKKNN